MNYLNDDLSDCTYVSTITEEECKEYIIKFAKILAKKKWWQMKGPILEEIIFYAKRLNN